MAVDHKELCDRLLFDTETTDSDAIEAACIIKEQAARIQQQALEYASLQAQCDEHLARIAETDLEREQAVAEAHGYRDCIAVLQRELEATRQERNAAGVKARRELMSAYEARIAELEKERDALKADAERYDFLRCRAELRDYCMGLYWHIKTVDVPMGMPLIDATLANVIDAAIQDEKETRS